jgi:hypothetical protein
MYVCVCVFAPVLLDGSYVKDYQTRLPKTTETNPTGAAAAAAISGATAKDVSSSPPQKNTMFSNLTGTLGMHRPWVIGLEHDWAVLLPAVAIVPFFFLLHAALFNAHGGWSFGSRMWLDVLPACTWLLVPVVQYILATTTSPVVPAGNRDATTTSKSRPLPRHHYTARTTAIQAMDGEPATGSRTVALGLVAVLVLGVGVAVVIQGLGLLAYTPQAWNTRAFSFVTFLSFCLSVFLSGFLGIFLIRTSVISVFDMQHTTSATLLL